MWYINRDKYNCDTKKEETVKVEPPKKFNIYGDH
jgi:hypothetical protein